MLLFGTILTRWKMIFNVLDFKMKPLTCRSSLTNCCGCLLSLLLLLLLALLCLLLVDCWWWSWLPDWGCDCCCCCWLRWGWAGWAGWPDCCGWWWGCSLALSHTSTVELFLGWIGVWIQLSAFSFTYSCEQEIEVKIEYPLFHAKIVLSSERNVLWSIKHLMKVPSEKFPHRKLSRRKLTIICGSWAN